MHFFDYDDVLFNANFDYGNEDLEMEKTIISSQANSLTYSGTFYIEQRGYSRFEAIILNNIRLHILIKNLINILITIDKKNSNSQKNNRLTRLVDSLLLSSLSSLDRLKGQNINTIIDYENKNTYNVNEFFEKQIDFCVMFSYRDEFNSLIGYNQITTELGALMGVYDMLFGEELLKLNKKYTTKYIFEMLHIII